MAAGSTEGDIPAAGASSAALSLALPVSVSVSVPIAVAVPLSAAVAATPWAAASVLLGSRELFVARLFALSRGYPHLCVPLTLALGSKKKVRYKAPTNAEI